MNTPPSPKKEFVEMTKDFMASWVPGLLPDDHESCEINLARWFQFVDASAREEKAEEAEKLFDAYHQVLQSESTPEDYDELKSLLKNGVPAIQSQRKNHDTPR